MLRESRTADVLIRRLDFPRLNVLPTHQPHGIVEQQVAFRLPAAHQQHGILVSLVLSRKPAVVHIVEYVDIVNQHGFIVYKQRGSLLQSPTRFEQCLRLVAEMHQRGIVLLAHIIHNLLGKMVDVHHKAVIALRLQLSDVQVQQRTAPHWHQRLGHGVRQRFQSGSKPRCQYHCLFHIVISGFQSFISPA